MKNEARINQQSLQVWLEARQQTFIKRLADQIKAEAEANAPRDTGDLAGSFSVEVLPSRRGSTRSKVTIKSSSPHAPFVEFGTGPAHQPIARGKYFPPHSAGSSLHRWAGSKGMNPTFVARGIYTHGTQPQPFMGPAIERVLAPYNFRIIRIKDR